MKGAGADTRRGSRRAFVMEIRHSFILLRTLTQAENYLKVSSDIVDIDYLKQHHILYGL